MTVPYVTCQISAVTVCRFLHRKKRIQPVKLKTSEVLCCMDPNQRRVSREKVS